MNAIRPGFKRSGYDKGTPPPGRDYTRSLRTEALKGARIGIPRVFYYERIAPARSRRR